MKKTIDFQKIYSNAKDASLIATFTRLLSNRNNRAAVASFSGIVFYLLQLKSNWAGLQASGIRGSSKYIDQESVLNSAKCFRAFGIEVYKLDTPNGCGGFVYSIELLRILNLFHLSDLSSELLGTAFMWLTLAGLTSLFFLIRNSGKLDNLVAILAIVSPGVWLLLERGNYDEFVFIVVLTSSYLLSSRYQELGIALLAITALMKFYTLPAFLIAIFFLKKRNSKIFFGLMGVPIIFYIAFLIKQVAAFPSTWFISFGLDSLGLYTNLVIKERISEDLQLPSIAITLVGASYIALLILCFVKVKLTNKIKLKTGGANHHASMIYITMLTIFLSCFFAGMNYDYRLIYLVAILALTPSILARGTFKNVVVISGSISLGFSTYAFGLSGVPALATQLFGDVVLYIFVSAQSLYLYELYVKTNWSRILQILRSIGSKSKTMRA
jgi:hypothetical protein